MEPYWKPMALDPRDRNGQSANLNEIRKKNNRESISTSAQVHRSTHLAAQKQNEPGPLSISASGAS